MERPPTNLHTATIVCSEMRPEYSTLEDVLQRNGSGRGWDMCAVLERHKNLLARLANRLVDGRDHCMSSWRLVGMRCGPWVTAHCGQQGSRCLQPARPLSSDRSGLDSDASHLYMCAGMASQWSRSSGFSGAVTSCPRRATYRTCWAAQSCYGRCLGRRQLLIQARILASQAAATPMAAAAAVAASASATVTTKAACTQ